MKDKKLLKTFEIDYYCPIDDTKLHPSGDTIESTSFVCSSCWKWYIEKDLKNLNKEELLIKYHESPTR